VVKVRSKAELEHELEALKLEYKTTRGLLFKNFTVVLVTIIVLTIAFFRALKENILNGYQFLGLVGIIVAGILVYYSFVFRREFKLKAKMSDKMKELEIASGKTAR
jgi:hypothetical protein